MQNNTFFGHSTPASLIVLDKVSSSNDFAKELLANFKPQLPYTAIMAKSQTAGRGQRGNKWSSPLNENLYVSFIHSPQNLLIQNQYLLTIKSSLACYDVLTYFIPKGLSIKWPNDIMVQNRKLGGILIENKILSKHITHSIIGIGINVLTTQFPDILKDKATSILLENKSFHLPFIDLAKMIRHRLIYYNNLINNKKEDVLWQHYTQHLFRKDIPSKFLINHNETEGIIRGVDKEGLLVLEIDNKLTKHDLKTITYQL